MKSVKRGRGPSFKCGLISVLTALFGVFWIILACAMGGWFMAPFGLIFVAVSITEAVYSFKNAAGRNRCSEFDITDDGEEPDMLNERFGGRATMTTSNSRDVSDIQNQINNKNYFCPYCGNAVDDDFAYCNKCGRKLPVSSERTEK